MKIFKRIYFLYIFYPEYIYLTILEWAAILSPALFVVAILIAGCFQ